MPSQFQQGAPHSRPSSALMPIASAAILWTECLHGQGSLRAALSSVADVATAEGVVLLRVTPTPRRVRIMSNFDRSASRGAEPLPQPLGPDMIPIALSRLRPGSLWSLQEAESLPTLRLEPRQTRWLEGRGLTEVLVITLGHDGDALDLLELHLAHHMTPGLRNRIVDLAEILAFAWSRRPEGRTARMLGGTPAIAQKALEQNDLTTAPLSISNPWRLTPTEMRICGLIRNGMSTSDVTEQMGVADSTLRCHLRNIYAKAGVSGQVGLLRALLETPAAKLA